MEKLIIPYPVVVEGKYDKIRLSNIIDAQIIVTDGFGIFKKEEKRLLLRRLASASPNWETSRVASGSPALPCCHGSGISRAVCGAAGRRGR